MNVWRIIAMIVLTPLLAPLVFAVVWLISAAVAFPLAGWPVAVVGVLCVLGTAGAINEAFDKHQDKEDERKLRRAALEKLKDE